MKVLMFGWEFPPFTKGGLGTACHGLTKGLKNNNVDVTFVLPKAPGNAKSDHVNLLVANQFYLDKEFMDSMKIYEIPSLLSPYLTAEKYVKDLKKYKHCIKQGSSTSSSDELYGKDVYAEVLRFAGKANLVAATEDHDVIHAHDWMTYMAGLEAKKVSGKPLVVHVHATEFDRTGGNGYNPFVYDIERRGMHEADQVIAVSQLTKDRIVNSYGVHPDKIHVVHNAVDFDTVKFNKEDLKIDKEEKVVLFLGRITLQKGPEYFLHTAKKVLDLSPDKNIKFIFAGSGDLEPAMINLAAELGISKNVLFTGWVKGAAIDKLYSMADLYVMPSITEPFGITPLEALRNGTPVLISKTSGVSEVLTHALKVDFWDVDEMTNMMMSVLNYNALKETLATNGAAEVLNFSWDEPAMKCANIYEMMAANSLSNFN